MAIQLKTAKDREPGFSFDDGDFVNLVQSLHQTLIDFEADLSRVVDSELFYVMPHDIGFDPDFFAAGNQDDQGGNDGWIVQSKPAPDRTALIHVNVEKHLPS